MSQEMHIFVFGDQTYDFVPELRQLLRSKTKPILNAFLEQAHYVVRAQMNVSLPLEERNDARTSNLAHLLQKYGEGGLSPAFQTALHCISQLGCFISHYEEVGRQYPTPGQTYLVGLCTGALATAAISSSSSLSELLPAAIHTVQIAFRLGLRAVELRDRIQIPEQGLRREWSAVFFGLEEAVAVAALAEFSNSKALPRTSRPWIGATAGKAITISAPPSVLQQLRQDSTLSKYKSKNIPIFLPSHTSHLFTPQDVEAILATTSVVKWAGFTAKLPVISGANGKTAWAGGFVPLVERALCECLLEPVRWDKVVEIFPGLVRSKGFDSVILTPIATNVEQSLASGLKAFATVTVERFSASDPTFFQPSSASKAKLAIVGMSGRFPEAQSPQAFWNLLYQGLDVCKEVPSKRWNVESHLDPAGKAKNKGATRWGCWLDFADQFDPRFFSISPKEAPQMDPAQRMALMSTFEAMEQAGIVSNTTPSTQDNRVGVFHGVTSNDYLECNSGQDIDTYFITGGNRGFIPGRINFCFEFCGPSFTNDTACSSSLAAIHLACNSLWRGDCDTAIAGGTNMIFNPDGHAGLDKGFFLSRTGNCKTFDDKADGYCRAEGVGTVFIKRLDDALAENDPILAVILDAKTNHSAMSDSMTRPHVGAQIDNMNAVLSDSNIEPKELSYIEMHGTGTQVGDAVEMESVLSIFAPNDSFREQDKPLYVGSAKASVGHGEGVSGIVSLAKVLLMMKHDTIPPHCGIKPGSKINHNYPDLGARNVHIARRPVPWKRGAEPRRVLINNFSAAGGNTALLIEDAPIRPAIQELDPRTSHIVTVTGHVVVSLKKNLQLLLDYISQEGPKGFSLPQLSWTTTARRIHQLFRVSITGATMTEIKQRLQEAIDRGDGTTRAKVKPKVIFAFTGQGSQFIGMGKQLFDAIPQFQSDILQFDQLARNLGFPSFIQVITAKEGDIDQNPPIVIQLATTSLQIALARLIKTFGVTPSAVVGHSLGEYAALHVAGVLTISDTLFLVGKRAELLQERCDRGTHSMLAIKASTSTVAKLLVDKKIEVACINGPEDTVISGDNEQIEAVKAIITTNGLKSILLKIPFAFHSAQVEPILQSFRAVAVGATYHKPSIAVLCPLTGEIVVDQGVFDPAYLTRHCREPVNMAGALQRAYNTQLVTDKTITMEIGPQPVVCGMIKATLGAHMLTLPIIQRNKEVWPNITAALQLLYNGGQDIDWVEYHAPFKSAHKVLELPAYGWDLKEYHIPYEGDWCLYKPFGPPKLTDETMEKLPMTSNQVHEKSKAEVEPKIDVTQKPLERLAVPKPESSTVHKVIEEKVESRGATLIYETDLTRPDANRVAQGHVVNNIPFCTPSVFADMAFILGEYYTKRFFPDYPAILDVSDMVAEKVLIPHSKGPQPLRTALKVEWAADVSNAENAAKSAKCEFYSVDAKGRTTAKHGWCTIRFQNNSQLRKLQEDLPVFASKIKRLRDGIKAGDFVRYNKTSGYKLMSTVAHFHPDYKLLDDMVLDESTLSATCTMNFASVAPGGIFAAHPAYVDAITQLGGFAVNAQDSTNLDDEVFISHGWESFQVYEKMKTNRTYEVYAQMERNGSEFYHGDTIVLDGSTVVAFFKGVSVRNVSRKTHRLVMQAFVDKTPRASDKAVATPQKAVSAPMMKKAPIKVPSIPMTPQYLASPKVPLPEPKVVVQPQLITATPNFANTASSKASENKKIKDAMKIISEESGIALTELTDDSHFADIGVDSLLSMVIGSRFREELDMDLDADFKIFVDCPTVKKLKVFLGDTVDDPQQQTNVDEVAGMIQEKEVAIVSAVNATLADPSSAASLAANLFEKVVQESLPSRKEIVPSAVRESPLVSSALTIISEESGIAMSELTDDSNFADIGVDSLLSMVIGSRFREELALDLEADFSIFVSCPTIRDLKSFLAGGKEVSSDDSSDSADGPSSAVTTPDTSDGEESFSKPIEYCKPATSVILQGVPKTATKTLFLLPDGSGSASSYVQIPRLKGNIALVGFNCPYAREPENMTCTHTSLINSYCNEIRRRQPSGPYHLGGWSSGGAFAFACAESLIKQGDEVHSLIIIDSPLPQVMERLPVAFYEFCGTLGLYGDEKPPEYLIPHFTKTVDVMLPYKAFPLKTSRMPKVGILWACDTVMDEKDAPKIKKTHFMTRKRKDFGPDGWDTVLPGAEFVLDRVVGGNHFTMMQKDHVQQISEFMGRVLA